MNSNDRHEILIQQAEDYRQQAVKRVHDRYRPMYHITPIANWMNDPNGLVFFQERYHVFYQHHPFNSNWGPMHWGHVVSDDLIHWTELPIALAPSEPYDEDGCFSGSAIEHEGKLYVFYTGHSNRKSPKEVQCMAVSADGVTFQKYALNPIIPSPPKEASEDFRDPKVWQHEGLWYLVLGTGKNRCGRVLLYRSKDLFSWEYVSVVSEGTRHQGYNWECPDILSVGDKNVLMISPEGMNDASNLYMVGEMNYITGQFVTEYTGQVDAGTDFYAPQSFQDKRGRTIVLGWMNNWNTAMPTQEDGWSGALTVPRQVQFNTRGQLTFQPVPELQELRRESVKYSNLLVTPYTNHSANTVRGIQLEIEVEYDLKRTDAHSFGVKFRCAQDASEETVLAFDCRNNELKLNRDRSGAGDKTASISIIETIDRKLNLTIFLDTSSVEVFVNGGESVMTNRIYPMLSSDNLQFFSVGGNTVINTLTVWRLRL